MNICYIWKECYRFQLKNQTECTVRHFFVVSETKLFFSTQLCSLFVSTDDDDDDQCVFYT